MYENNLTKQYFSKGAPKALVALKTVSAVLLIAVVILALSSGMSSMSLGMLGGIGGVGAMAAGGVMLYFLPIFALIGMAIVWAVALSRCSAAENDGSVLRSTAAASLALSIMSFIALLGVILIMIGALSMSSSYYGASSILPTNDKALAITTLILTAIGFIALLPTAISRMIFYRNVQKSMNGTTANSGGASVYAIAKIVNAVVKAGFGVVMIITMAKQSYTPAVGIIFYVCTILAFFLGAVANIIEARLVLGFKKAVAPPTYNYPQPTYGAPAYPANPYAAPTTYQPQTPPAESVYNPYVNNVQQPAEQPVAQDTAPTCPNCGAEVKPNAVFCGSCGTKL